MSEERITFIYDLESEELKMASREDLVFSRLCLRLSSENNESRGEYVKELSPGAEIFFSTTVSDKKVYGWLQRVGYSLLNRFLEKGKTRKIILDNFGRHGIVEFGWTIVTGMEGGYTDLNDKDSKSIERSNKIILNNTPMEIVEDIATELCRYFRQQSVLIHDLEKNTYRYWKAS